MVAERLVFPEPLRQELIEHARAGNPDEVCGMLGGRDGRVERVFPIRNTADAVGPDRGVFRDRETGTPAAGRKAVHYYMDPQDQLRVYNELDDLGLDLLAYYHSHTHTEARPSATDIRLASDLSALYVLIGLEDPGTPSIRAWRIAKAAPHAETGDLLEIPIIS